MATLEQVMAKDKSVLGLMALADKLDEDGFDSTEARIKANLFSLLSLALQMTPGTSRMIDLAPGVNCFMTLPRVEARLIFRVDGWHGLSFGHRVTTSNVWPKVRDAYKWLQIDLENQLELVKHFDSEIRREAVARTNRLIHILASISCT